MQHHHPQVDDRMLAYLAQQRVAGHPVQPIQPAGVYAPAEVPPAEPPSTALVEVPSNEELEDFKNQVRLYLELDNALRKLKAAVKERQAAKRELTEHILDFMGKYNIEDLNTRDGKLRYKVVNVKEPLPQSVIKERIKEKIETGKAIEDNASVVVEEVFQRSGTVKKAVLKRLKRRTTHMDVGAS